LIRDITNLEAVLAGKAFRPWRHRAWRSEGKSST